MGRSLAVCILMPRLKKLKMALCHNFGAKLEIDFKRYPNGLRILIDKYQWEKAWRSDSCEINKWG